MANSTRQFGHIEGIQPGATFKDYSAMNAAGIHRQSQGGISGSGLEGADSIVVSGGYEDDRDYGDEIVYTGQGGRDSSGKQIADQELVRGNLALVKSQLEGLPVRVIRGAHKGNSFAPLSGYRYDGLYLVDSHWHENGKSGFKIWRFRLLKLVDNTFKAVPTLPEEKDLRDTGNATPTRKLSQIQRIVRDTKIAKSLKKYYSYKCQVCGVCLMAAGVPYAEAAHIKPLGAPHNGSDTIDNILCLCPNHHVMFDFGSFSINDDLSLIGIEGKLYVGDKHSINPDYLNFHRNFFYTKNIE